MTMFMNIDALPAGTKLYTLYVVSEDVPEGTPRSEMHCDEVDVTCARVNGAWNDAPNYGKVHPTGEHVPTYLMETYGDGVRIVGIVNQSDGFVVYDAFKAGDETGADDL
jgi:hypothetical protein